VKNIIIESDTCGMWDPGEAHIIKKNFRNTPRKVTGLQNLYHRQPLYPEQFFIKQ